jgi:hypothetical protein
MGVIQQHCQPLADPPSPDGTDPKVSAFSNVTSTRPIKIKYCEDTRPQNQLSAAQEQHRGLLTILKTASVTLHTILLGVGGMCNSNTLMDF